MNAVVGVGMIGAGGISDYHLSALTKISRADVRIICGSTRGRAAAQARRYDIPEVAGHWSEVLRRPDVQAVVIATPDHTHYELVMAAVERGKSVLVQKPLGSTVGQGVEMVRAAEQQGAVLCVAFMHRFLPETVALREALDDGVLGDIHMVRVRNATPGADWGHWFYERPPVGGGGVVVQLGIHGIDLLLHVFGDVESVSGCVGRALGRRSLADGTVVYPEVEDYALAHYRMADGLVVSHEMSYTEVAGCDRFRMEVYGSTGTAWLRQPTDGLALFTRTHGGDPRWNYPRLSEITAGERQHAAFLDQVQGRTPVDGSARDALRGLSIVESLYAAAKQGCWAAVDTAEGAGR